MRNFLIVPMLLVALAPLNAETVVDFESLPVNASGYFQGENTGAPPLRDNYTVIRVENGDFGGTDNQFVQEWTSGGLTFSNQYADYSSFTTWSGFSWSKVTDATTAGNGNEYASFPGGGANLTGGLDAGGVYAVGFQSGYINIPERTAIASLFFTNTTYTGLAVSKGDDGGNNFISGAYGSGLPGLDPDGNDFLRITFEGFDGEAGTGTQVGSLTRYLADYRDDKSDNVDAAMFGGEDYTLGSWQEADFTSLAGARSITFSIEGTDIGPFGPNTPSYFAFDNVTLTSVPEPSSAFILGFSAMTVLGVRRRRRVAGRKA